MLRRYQVADCEMLKKALRPIRKVIRAFGLDIVDRYPYLIVPPPRHVPKTLVDRFTMNGRMQLDYNYLNNTYSSKRPIVYTVAQINYLIEKIKKHETNTYGETDTWLYQAIVDYPIQGKSIVIMGSVIPWYESICLYYGGSSTTIEYNRIISEHPKLKVMTPEEHDRSFMQYDIGLSISTFEHDGLGRYGDRINPDGDIEAMEKMRHIVKPGGLLFLSVPVGKDTLVWNDARIYGRVRLPMLLRGWEVLSSYGYDDSWETLPESEPVFVLRNKIEQMS
jgi:hypothetical protein